MIKSDFGQPAMLKFLILLTIASSMGLQTWMILFNNFAVDVAGLNGQQVGVIGSVREIPGLLALLVVYVLLVISEHRLAALSVVVVGVGSVVTGFLPSYGGLIFSTLVISFGFHYYETTNQSLTLQYFDIHTSPLIFGRLKSLTSAVNIAMGLTVFVLGLFLEYQTIFILIGVAVALVGLWGLCQNPSSADVVPQRQRMVFRRKYFLFYFLTCMAGARRQIFIAFSVFLLVKEFDCSVTQVAALFVVNNLINYFVSPMIGRAIVRFGERKVLSLEYGSLIAVFLGYAWADSLWVVMGLYVIDHILFSFAMAIRTYFQKVADPRDVAPSMAVGFTINHVAAVVMPVIGGALWMIDYSIPFIAGSIMSGISLVAVQWIRTDVSGIKNPA
ncbi:MFS transporter [Desulfuromonas acetoxidans]|uniref:Major facilitator superfamily MFS_1 n=1 Tax=Desulfuromonas acetoxidans (strain DSM 684 / 11070) TaxID=281689 RepID=Q1JVA6_DESA6|nr:MFS transporter [Desulfuromonas acetoxidans]EAT14177.1 major facilitator superfamily MFS_1 [Desulfuromonas acetoxidans DSM 684]MBF0645028.1 MFS transporter [Desulfuromonas acetoxidans]NVD23162.1 MFS transporter [Desulfuromonas acetoxidans]NVE15597.1 MFS transporter [Desulfuromonas acetoxidans]